MKTFPLGRSLKPLMSVVFVLLFLAGSSELPAQSFFKKLGLTGQTGSVTNLNVSALTDDQVVNGLKEALANGVQQAVSKLGQTDGFLTNLTVRIPMPENLQKIEKTLRSLKQERLADEFVSTMNRAAEQAVPQAAAIFGDSIKQMSIADAKSILTGPQDAATQYFRKTSTNALREKFLPIVKVATEKAGVTAAYKQMADKVQLGSSSGLGKSFGSTLGALGYKTTPPDLDTYVTDKAIDGLFKMVADEEKRIRENPVARSTDLLKQVFGAVQK